MMTTSRRRRSWRHLRVMAPYRVRLRRPLYGSRLRRCPSCCYCCCHCIRDGGSCVRWCYGRGRRGQSANYHYQQSADASERERERDDLRRRRGDEQANESARQTQPAVTANDTATVRPRLRTDVLCTVTVPY